SSPRKRRLLSLLIVVLTALAGSVSAFAQVSQSSNFTATPLAPSDQTPLTVVRNNAAQSARRFGASSKLVGVIVKLSDAPLATYKGDLPGLAATSPRVTGAPKVDTQS